jgi:hypothetical protein
MTMNVRLEDELVAGMREQTAALRPSADLLDRAARANRRRTVGMGVATGAFALAAVLAVTMAQLGGTPAAPGLRTAPEMLTVAQVSERAVAALAADDLQRVTWSVTADGRYENRFVAWFDQTTGDTRLTSLYANDTPYEEVWLVLRAGTLTITDVDHEARTWCREIRPEAGTATTVGPAGGTPDELRAALRDGRYTLVGAETLDGRAVQHLRQAGDAEPDELWVDSETYRAVRRVIVENTRMQMDFEWLARTAESLAPLTVTIPPGYTERPAALRVGRTCDRP